MFASPHGNIPHLLECKTYFVDKKFDKVGRCDMQSSMIQLPNLTSFSRSSVTTREVALLQTLWQEVIVFNANAIDHNHYWHRYHDRLLSSRMLPNISRKRLQTFFTPHKASQNQTSPAVLKFLTFELSCRDNMQNEKLAERFLHTRNENVLFIYTSKNLRLGR